MKAIFIIDNNMPNSTGGGYYSLFKFAEALADRGHRIMIYAVYDHQWVSRSANLQLFFRPKISRRGRILRKIDKALEILCDRVFLEKRISEFRPDWLFGVLTDSAIKAARLGKKKNIPVGNFVYETPPWLEDVHGKERCERDSPPYVRKLWLATRQAYAASQVLFPNSEVAGKYAAAWLGSGSRITLPIYPGISEKEMLFDERGNDAGPPVDLLYVGRLAPDKNVDLLIRAVREIPAKPSLHICGSGPEMARLKDLAGTSGSIVFHGFVADRFLWAMFRKCRVVVFPTSFEGFGMPPMQALYFGKPCLASDLPVFRSIYKDHLEYFPKGDPAALTAGIERLLADPDYCRKRGRIGREYVLQNFTWQRAAARIESCLPEFAAPGMVANPDIHRGRPDQPTV